MIYYITYSGTAEIEAENLEEARQIFFEAVKDNDVAMITTEYNIEKVNW